MTSAMAVLLGLTAGQVAPMPASIDQATYNDLFKVAVTVVCVGALNDNGALLENEAALKQVGFTPSVGANKLGGTGVDRMRAAGSAGPSLAYINNYLGLRGERCLLTGKDKARQSLAADTLLRAMVPAATIAEGFKKAHIIKVPLPPSAGGRRYTVDFFRTASGRQGDTFIVSVLPDDIAKAN